MVDNLLFGAIIIILYFFFSKITKLYTTEYMYNKKEDFWVSAHLIMERERTTLCRMRLRVVCKQHFEEAIKMKNN